jgi:hypothetical protein
MNPDLLTLNLQDAARKYAALTNAGFLVGDGLDGTSLRVELATGIQNMTSCFYIAAGG